MVTELYYFIPGKSRGYFYLENNRMGRASIAKFNLVSGIGVEKII